MSPGDPLVVRRETLENGLTLVRQDAPAGAGSVAVTWIGPAGTAFDPPEASGTAVVAGELAVVAAGARDRRAMARHLDALGATLSEHPSPECLEITAWGPRERWRELTELIADAVLHPRFAPDDLARSLRQMRERQMRERTQPDLRAEVELLHAMFPSGHPYHRTGLGDARTLRRITPAALRRFHRAHASTEGAHVVATGRIPSDGLKALVLRRFGRSTVRAPSPPELPRPRSGAATTRHVELPGRAQVEIRLGTAIPPRSDPRFPALFLADEVLGGQMLLSRLFQRIREREGLAYHASSELEAMAWGGSWEAQAGTGPERADAVEALIRREFDAILERTIPEAELDRIRESCIGSIALDVETTHGAHDLGVASAYYGLPDDFYRTWPATLRALRPRAILDAVGSAVDRDRLRLVRVGPGSSGG